jgi:hypothetical protein
MKLSKEDTQRLLDLIKEYEACVSDIEYLRLSTWDENKKRLSVTLLDLCKKDIANLLEISNPEEFGW